MSGQYKGDVTPQEAWELLASDKNAVLVDVRTLAEWKCVGVTDLSSLSKDNIYIEWVSLPDGTPNGNFLAELEKAVPNKEASIYFLCRTGVRSIAAAIAATSAGFGNSHNILEGFEGGQDDKGHRGRVSGWQGRDLSWKH
ncbi:MAG: rhodanese-like domain-containing protein [Emcibacteraceae bacterium]|nr:rhodanese-like domain-containing protein [Emcibacteraceae bacterium]